MIRTVVCGEIFWESTRHRCHVSAMSHARLFILCRKDVMSRVDMRPSTSIKVGTFTAELISSASTSIESLEGDGAVPAKGQDLACNSTRK